MTPHSVQMGRNDALRAARLRAWRGRRPQRLPREPGQALEIARTVATVAAETRSARMRRELTTLEQAMRPWHDAPVGRDPAEVLTPVTDGS